MIIGIFLRSVKIYNGINYIPITSGDNFCGLLGNNGIGKSSILESLDTFFNNKSWNYNNIAKKSGLSTTEPSIVPVFLIEKSKIPDELKELAEKLDKLANEVNENTLIAPKSKFHLKGFIQHRDALKKNISIEDKYLIPLGIDYNGNTNISIFKKISTDVSDLGDFTALLNLLKKTIEYIYIPKEIDPQEFTKLETNEIQILMGKSLHEIIEKTVTKSQLQKINKDLLQFINTLEAQLVNYKYMTPTTRQQNLKKTDLHNLIIDAFFSTRKLHKKKEDNNWLEISLLSSGEKQRAIIDIAKGFLTKDRDAADNLIIAIDEPESSLHMSACFEQFDSIYEVSKSCMQVIFSSHWYGYLPVLKSGSTTIITNENKKHSFDILDLSRYREQVKEQKKSSSGKLPFDIRLKGINDFIQSIVCSIIGEKPFNWILCEGTSDKIYLSHFFKEEIVQNNLRIIPVGGATEIKKYYKHIYTSCEDFKKEITGKIFLLSDTDSDIVSYDTIDTNNITCKRMINIADKQRTDLISIKSNPVSPATEIEDTLDCLIYYKTLLTFANKHEELKFLYDIDEKTIKSNTSSYYLDIKQSQQETIRTFFNKTNIKYEFANVYVDLSNNDYVPTWINEIRKFLIS